MLTLKNPYITVQYKEGPCFGGSQQRSNDAVIARCGCGVIAAMDTLLYLSRHQPDCGIDEFKSLSETEPVLGDTYDSCVRALSRRYFPLLPPLGMNGLTLAVGMELFIKRHGLPLTARWGVSRDKLWPRIEEMLRADIPVIMSVGPNFPLFWQQHKAKFYVYSDGGYKRAAYVNAHYVTAVAMDGDWIEISSWGRRYYINKAEYLEFADRHTTSLLSNILYIRRK